VVKPLETLLLIVALFMVVCGFFGPCVRPADGGFFQDGFTKHDVRKLNRTIEEPECEAKLFDLFREWYRGMSNQVEARTDARIEEKVPYALGKWLKEYWGVGVTGTGGAAFLRVLYLLIKEKRRNGHIGNQQSDTHGQSGQGS